MPSPSGATFLAHEGESLSSCVGVNSEAVVAMGPGGDLAQTIPSTVPDDAFRRVGHSLKNGGP
jgi:hypothetical protein